MNIDGAISAIKKHLSKSTIDGEKDRVIACASSDSTVLHSLKGSKRNLVLIGRGTDKLHTWNAYTVPPGSDTQSMIANCTRELSHLSSVPLTNVDATGTMSMGTPVHCAMPGTFMTVNVGPVGGVYNEGTAATEGGSGGSTHAMDLASTGLHLLSGMTEMLG